MNLHKAKGLEAPIVFLADPHGESDHSVIFHIDRSGDKIRGYLAIKGSQRNTYIAQPENWDVLSEREKRFELAERLRLRYVAATRAKSAMIITHKNKRNHTNPWKYFSDFLDTNSEIPDPGNQQAPEIEERLILPEEIDYYEKCIDENHSFIKTATYGSFTAKDYALLWIKETGRIELGIDIDTKNVIESSSVEEVQHGINWGTVIHRLLQYSMENPNIELQKIAEEELQENDLDPILASNVIDIVQSIIQSEIWQRAMRSDKRYTEFPFEICLSDSDSESLPLLVRGAIDLVFHEPDGWVIVDYKTDIVTNSTLKSIVRKYTPQILLYTDVWKRTTKEPVKELGLYFSHIDQFMPIR
jgi:ATP-dependent helicase/nuclease subunit A